ncbi:MAG: DUF502 domain-containing protein [Campylobacterota bacterium]|nr:DUF502 domain-containing protein [Campylobacterota bacterium]
MEKIKRFFAGGWGHFLKMSIQGFFWLAPIIGILAIFFWLYGKIDIVTGFLFSVLGLNPQNFIFLWTVLGVAILLVIAYTMGHFMQTQFGKYFEGFFNKIPGYTVIKDIVSIFNSSKKGDKQVLVVLIKGFIGNQDGYNVGLMYSLKESIVKGHYTVSLNMSPLPNGGFMFEIPADKIFIIKGASFDHNLQYLLSMGSKPLSEIVGCDVSEVGSESLPSLEEYLN